MGSSWCEALNTQKEVEEERQAECSSRIVRCGGGSGNYQYQMWRRISYVRHAITFYPLM